jgi:hypothetical protein
MDSGGLMEITPATGQALLSQLKTLQHLSCEERVRQCGWGKNFSGFYEALLMACNLLQ